MQKKEVDFFSRAEIITAVLNSLSSHIALVDEKGFITDVNDAWKLFAKNNGLNSSNYGIGVNYIEFANEIHGQDVGFGKEMSKALQDIIAGKLNFYSTEYPCHSPSKQQWFKAVVTPLRDHSVSGAVISHSDITERVLAGRQLQKNEEKFRYLVEQASDGIFMADSDLKILEVNNAACNQLGYTSSELQTLYLPDLFFESDLKITPLKIEELEFGKTVIIERRFKRKDGTAIEVEIHSKKLTDGRYHGVSRDISERNRTTSSLAKKENHLRTILNTAPECIKLLSKDFVCRSMNPAGLKMIEVDSEADVIGHSILEMIDEPYRLAFSQLISDSYHDIPGKIEIEITTLKGHHRWIDARLVPLKDQDGNIESCLCISSDVTERIKAKHALQISHARLKKSFSSIQTIVENERKEISRELHDECGQNLTALHLDIAWLKKRFQPDQIKEKQLIDEMKVLVDSLLLTVQRISKNLRPPVLEYFDLQDALDWLIADFEKRSKIKCQLIMSVDNSKMYEPIKVTIFRILQESLTNALRHSDASRILISIREKDNKLNLLINDNGKGISTENINDINSLGILGMQERVESLKGSFSITGSTGKGTNLKISLPFI